MPDLDPDLVARNPKIDHIEVSVNGLTAYNTGASQKLDNKRALVDNLATQPPMPPNKFDAIDGHVLGAKSDVHKMQQNLHSHHTATTEKLNDANKERNEISKAHFQKARRERDLALLHLYTARQDFQALKQDTELLHKSHDGLLNQAVKLTAQIANMSKVQSNGPSKEEWSNLVVLAGKTKKSIEEKFKVSSEQAARLKGFTESSKKRDERILGVLDALEKKIEPLGETSKERHEQILGILGDLTKKVELLIEKTDSSAQTLADAHKARSQRDDLTISTISQLVGANRTLTDTIAKLTGKNAYLAATVGEATEANQALAKGNFASNVGISVGLVVAGQQARDLEAAPRKATDLQFTNTELSHEKWSLELDVDEMAEELERSRRRRTDTPNGGNVGPRSNLERIKIWTSSQENFTDLHASVQQAIRTCIDGHLLGAAWFETAQRGVRSCMRNKRQERCMVPAGGSDKVACGQCVGGKTFCIRRRVEDDNTLCLFPLHAIERRNASVDDVTYWRMEVKKMTPPGFYDKKLYA